MDARNTNSSTQSVSSFASKQLEEFICPITTEVFFEPVMISGCGHMVEGRMAASLRKCPTCRAGGDQISIVAAPPIVASMLERTLDADPSLWQQVYLNHDYLEEVIQQDELHALTGERFIRLLQNNTVENLNIKATDGKQKGKSAIEILSSCFVGRELLRSNQKIQSLISAETKLIEVNGKTIANWLALKSEGNQAVQKNKKVQNRHHQLIQNGLFANAHEPARRVENNVWQRTVDGRENEAAVLFEVNPELIITKHTIIEHTKRPLADASPFQIALRCGDVEMAAMIKRIALDRIPNGQARLDEQYKEVFPHGYDQHMRVQEANTFNFTAIVNAISHADPEDLQVALDKRNNGSDLCHTLDEFRATFDAKSLNEKVFNPNHVLKAQEIYNASFENWSWNQCDLFWRQIIGYTQRYLPSCYKQVFCQGLHNLTQKIPKDAFLRVETLDNWITNQSSRFANIDEDPNCRLGFDFAVYSLCRVGASVQGGIRPTTCSIFSRLLSDKNIGIAALTPPKVTGVLSRIRNLLR